MKKYFERGYAVLECSPVYVTSDVEKTLQWFIDTLGWYGSVGERQHDGTATYACVLSMPDVLKKAQILPIAAFHIMKGEPSKNLLAQIKVVDILKLYEHLKKNGHTQMGDIENEHWGAKVLTVTTPDSYTLRFFEEN